MKKRGSLRYDVLIALIISILIIGFLLYVSVKFGVFASRQSNIDLVSNWVNEKAASKLAVGGERPPIRELDKPLVIDNPKDLRFNRGEYPKAYQEIADSMYDCWRAFNQGTTNFVGTIDNPTDVIKNVKKQVFCYGCRAISFSDDVKNEIHDVSGFLRFLNEKKPVEGENKPTYLQYLSNNDNLVLKNEDLEDDDKLSFTIDKDLFIMMFAASGRAWSQIALELVGVQSGDLEAAKEYSATDVSSGREAERDSTKDKSGLSNIAAGSVVGSATATNTARKFIANKVADALSSEGSAVAAEQITAKIIGNEIVFDIEEKVAEKAIAKAAGKVLIKGLAKTLGTKIIPGIGWAYTAVELGLGTYRLIFNPKPFVATVMIVEPDKFLTKCNEDVPAELKNPTSQAPSEKLLKEAENHPLIYGHRVIE